jgi:hypothetical protein
MQTRVLLCKIRIPRKTLKTLRGGGVHIRKLYGALTVACLFVVLAAGTVLAFNYLGNEKEAQAASSVHANAAVYSSAFWQRTPNEHAGQAAGAAKADGSYNYGMVSTTYALRPIMHVDLNQIFPLYRQRLQVGACDNGSDFLGSNCIVFRTSGGAYYAFDIVGINWDGEKSGLCELEYSLPGYLDYENAECRSNSAVLLLSNSSPTKPADTKFGTNSNYAGSDLDNAANSFWNTIKGASLYIGDGPATVTAEALNISRNLNGGEDPGEWRTNRCAGTNPGPRNMFSMSTEESLFIYHQFPAETPPLAIDIQMSGTEQELSSCGTLGVGGIYTVTADRTIQGENGKPCLIVPPSGYDNVYVTINIASGVTFNVNGGNATASLPGGSGIQMSGTSVTNHSRLVIRGEGILNVKGGNAASPTAGGNGARGEAKWDGGEGYSQIRSGAGGSGGRGSNGEGAAIGSNGSTGGASSSGAEGCKSNLPGAGDSLKCNGSSSSPSNNGASIANYVLGKIDVFGSVQVNASAGDAPTPSTAIPTTGKHGNVPDSYNFSTYYYGGGGGAGANGCVGNGGYALGVGGSGGAGGNAGAGGGTTGTNTNHRSKDALHSNNAGGGTYGNTIYPRGGSGTGCGQINILVWTGGNKSTHEYDSYSSNIVSAGENWIRYGSCWLQNATTCDTTEGVGGSAKALTQTNGTQSLLASAPHQIYVAPTATLSPAPPESSSNPEYILSSTPMTFLQQDPLTLTQGTKSANQVEYTLAGGSGIGDYFIASSGACSGSGTTSATITFSSAGTCTITANREGDADYYPATEVTQVLTVHSLTQAKQTSGSGFTGTAPYHTVSGENPEVVYALAGTTLNLAPNTTFSRIGYTYTQICASLDSTGNGTGTCSNVSTTYTMPSADTTLYPQWTSNIITYRYVLPAGAFGFNLPTSNYCYYGEPFTPHSPITPQGNWDFQGYMTDDSGWTDATGSDVTTPDSQYSTSTTTCNGNTDAVNVYLYAILTVRTTTLHFNNMGGSIAAPADISVPALGDYTLPNYTGIKSGWTFAGWQSSDTNPANNATICNGSSYLASSTYTVTNPHMCTISTPAG